MANQETQLQNFTLSDNDIIFYQSLLHRAYQAAITYDGTEQADRLLFEPLNEIDKFVIKVSGGVIDEGLERRFSDVVEPEWSKNHPHTVHALLEEAAKFYIRIESANSFDAVIDSLEKSGVYVVRTQAVYIETDEVEPVLENLDSAKKFEVRTQPRLALLIRNLKEIGIYTDDLILYVGHVRDNMMRQYPYVIVQIPRLNKEVAVCDQVGEATFIGHKMHDVAVWEYLTKQQMRDRDDFDRIVFREEAQWWNDIYTHLRGKAPQIAKIAKKDVAKFARKKPPLDVDLIKQSIRATYEAIGNWGFNDGIIQYGPYAYRENWGGVRSAMRANSRGMSNINLAVLKEEVALENGWEYSNNFNKSNLSIKNIKECIRLHYIHDGEWVGEGIGLVKYGPYKGELTWSTISNLLKRADEGQRARGLPAGYTLSLLKQEVASENGWDYKKNYKNQPLTIEGIKACIIEHYEETGEWPTGKSGRVQYGPYKGKENWSLIQDALYNGYRQLPEGYTLTSLKEDISVEKGWPLLNTLNLPDLEIDKIKLCIASHYYNTNGEWVTEKDEDVLYGPYANQGERWMNIATALYGPKRGLPAGHTLSSLKKEVAQEYGWNYQSHLEKPNLSITGIKECIQAHYEATGKWVSENSGDVLYGPCAHQEEKWMNIKAALSNGGRGLPKGKHTIRSLKEEVAKEQGWPLRKFNHIRISP